jgi:hypothetical protein
VSFLHAYIDPKITVRADDSAEAITRSERERLQQLYAVALAAASHPRRLGGDAMPEELALDKKRSKRIAHAVGNLLRDWQVEPQEYPDATKDAAIINWLRWWSAHEQYLLARQRYIATWCHRYGDSNGDIRWAKSAVTRLNNELKHLSNAMR